MRSRRSRLPYGAMACGVLSAVALLQIGAGPTINTSPVSKVLNATDGTSAGPHSSYPSAPAADSSGFYNVDTTAAGVTLGVRTNFLPSGFEAQAPGSAIQGALAARDNPLREFEIQGATYGAGLPLEGVARVAQGDARRVIAHLAAEDVSYGRTADRGEQLTADLFGQIVTGRVTNTLDTTIPGEIHRYLGAEWVTEALGRLWVVRVSIEQSRSDAGFESTHAFFAALSIHIAAKLASPVGANAYLDPVLAASVDSIPSIWPGVSMPSWWGGHQCDSARTGSYAAYTASNGLVACWPNPDVYASGFPTLSGVQQPLEFECVELSKRWLYQAYGQRAYAANGNQVVSNYPVQRLKKVSNNGTTYGPTIGDVISFNNSGNSAGHTAVVYATTVNNGSGTVSVIEENATSSGHENFTMSGGILRASGVLTPISWLHDFSTMYTTTRYLRNSNSAGGSDMTFNFGVKNGVAVAGDWTGSGVATQGYYSNGTWYLRNTNSAGAADTTFSYGAATDIPVVGDWTGKCYKSVGVFRGGAWYLRNSNTAGSADISFSYGLSTDIPVVGDWTGQYNPSTGCAIDTIGVFRKGSWYLRNSNSAGAADISFGYGVAGDEPVVGDWTGQHGSPTAPLHMDTPGLFRNGTWYLRNSNTAGAADITFGYGLASDAPLVGDWTGQTSGFPWYERIDTPEVAR